MVAEDAAYVGFKMAAVSRGLAGIGATHLAAASAAGAVAAETAAAAPPTAALRGVTIPGFGQRRQGGGDEELAAGAGVAAAGATAGSKRPRPASDVAPRAAPAASAVTADLLLRNGLRGSATDPILNGPTCVPTGGGGVLPGRSRASDSVAPAVGRRAAALAAMLAPIRAPVDGRLRPAAGAAGGGAPAAGADIPLALLEAAAAAKAVAANKKVAVTQTVKFAGKTMTVTRLVTPGTAAAKAIAEEASASAARAAIAAAAAAGEGGGGDASSAAAAAAPSAGAVGGGVSLDALVANLDKPEAISTLTKSSLDWDTYKHAHGLDDELERCVRAPLCCGCWGKGGAAPPRTSVSHSPTATSHRSLRAARNPQPHCHPLPAAPPRRASWRSRRSWRAWTSGASRWSARRAPRSGPARRWRPYAPPRGAGSDAGAAGDVHESSGTNDARDVAALCVPTVACYNVTCNQPNRRSLPVSHSALPPLLGGRRLGR
jgi:hypothetical protein